MESSYSTIMVFPTQKMNLHAHSRWSDGRFSISDLLALAAKSGLEILGISDHIYTTKLPPEKQVQDLSAYIESVKNFAPQAHAFGLKLKTGIEIDCSEDMGVDPVFWDLDGLNRLDYILLEYVNEGWAMGRALEKLAPFLRPRITIPIGLCHNNIMEYFHLDQEEPLQRFIGCLTKYEIFIELNQSELGRNTAEGRDYFELWPDELFVHLRDGGVRFSIGTDAHETPAIGAINRALEVVRRYGLQLIV